MAIGSVSNSVTTPPVQSPAVNPNNGNLEKAVEQDGAKDGCRGGLGGEVALDSFESAADSKSACVGTDDLFE